MKTRKGRKHNVRERGLSFPASRRRGTDPPFGEGLISWLADSNRRLAEFSIPGFRDRSGCLKTMLRDSVGPKPVRGEKSAGISTGSRAKMAPTPYSGLRFVAVWGAPVFLTRARS